jgi:hypothetical protein
MFLAALGGAERALAPRPNKLGVHLLLDDGRTAWPVRLWPEHLRYARQVVGEWGYVTQLIRADDLDIGRWQGFMDLCAELHLTPIVRLATTYDRARRWWTAPESDADGPTYRGAAIKYAAFVAGLRWPTAKHYIIVGNEPNHGDEWGGRPDPAAYARFLIDVADALHAAEPGAQVLNAGFDPYTAHTGSKPFTPGGVYNMDEDTFLDEMIAAQPDVFRRLNAWASHAYPPGPFSAGPWEQRFGIDWLNDAHNPRHREPPPGVYNRGVNGYRWELFKLTSYGVSDLPVMITETGWRHSETTDPAALDGSPDLPTAEIVARYLDLALRGEQGRYPDLPGGGWMPWLADPHVIAVTPFALNGLPAEWGHTNWLKLDVNGAVLGVYAPFETVAALARSYRSAQ